MKLFHNLFTVLVACFCMSTIVFSQEPQTIDQLLVDNVLSRVDSSGSNTGQSFTLYQTATVVSIKVPVFARYDTASHLGTLKIMQGHGLQGLTVFEQPIVVPGLNKFHSSSYLATIDVPEFEQLWGFSGLQGLVCDDSIDFFDLATEFPVEISLPAGAYTFMFSLDATPGNGLGTWNYITFFMNCYYWNCDDQEINPYLDGESFAGLGLNQDGNRDLAFQVEYLPEISTSIEEPTPELLVNGIVAEAWGGADMDLYDAAGRMILSKRLTSGEHLEIPTGQVYIARLSRNDQPLAVKKILVSL